MFRILFSIALVVFGVMIVVGDMQDKRDAVAFRARGETARVESIANIRQHEVTKRRSSEVTHRYQTGDVTFKTKDGERVTVPSKPLPPNASGNVATKQGLTIWYLPDRPTTVRFRDIEDDEPARSNPLALRLVGLLLAALGLVYGWRLLRRR